MSSERQERGAYLCLPTTCLAAMACRFFCSSLLALACFWVACLFTALGDLSPMVFCLSFDVHFIRGVPDSSEGTTIMPLYGRLCKQPEGFSVVARIVQIARSHRVLQCNLHASNRCVVSRLNATGWATTQANEETRRHIPS